MQRIALLRGKTTLLSIFLVVFETTQVKITSRGFSPSIVRQASLFGGTGWFLTTTDILPSNGLRHHRRWFHSSKTNRTLGTSSVGHISSRLMHSFNVIANLRIESVMHRNQALARFHPGRLIIITDNFPLIINVPVSVLKHTVLNQFLLLVVHTQSHLYFF